MKLPAAIEALYDFLLTRTEELHGEKFAREFANLLAVTRGGLRAPDLAALLPGRTGEPWDDLRFAALRRSFRAHLIQKGALGQWDFTHLQVRAAIFKRSLPTPEARREVHRALAEHLRGLGPGLRQTELMFHLIGADDGARAARCNAGLDSPDPESAHILAGAGQDPNPGLGWTLSLPRQPGLTDAAVAQLGRNYQFDLLKALENDAPLSLRLSFLQEVRRVQVSLAAQDPANAGWQRDLAVSYCKLAQIYHEQGKGTETTQHLKLGRQTLRVMREMGMFLDPLLEELLKQLEVMDL